MTDQNLINDIMGGVYDDRLDIIESACRQRKKVQGDINLMTLTPGTKVRLRGLSPKYLNGQTGVIADGRQRGKRLNVKLDHPVGKFRSGIVTPPASCVEVVK